MYKFIVSSVLPCFIFVTVFGQKEAPIKLDYFKEIPSEIDGCSGSFTYDSIPLKNQKYVVVVDLQNLAFVRINGTIIRLTLSEHKNITKNKSKDSYQGGGYSVILTTTEGRRIGDELYLSSGTIEISNGKQKSIFKIHGEAGC
jgi:hypothetical protein